MNKMCEYYCLLLLQLYLLLLTSARRQSNTVSSEKEQSYKWVEGGAIVSNEIIRYEGFLGFGVWIPKCLIKNPSNRIGANKGL